MLNNKQPNNQTTKQPNNQPTNQPRLPTHKSRSVVLFGWFVRLGSAEERQRQWWSFLHPRLLLSKRQRQWRSTLHPCPQCFKRHLTRAACSHCACICRGFHHAFSPYTVFLSLTSVFRCRDTLPGCHWHQESQGHRDSDKFFVETPSCGRGRARAWRAGGAGHACFCGALGVRVETHKKREKQLAVTLLHLSHELQSCPSHGHTMTLLGLLAGGRGPIPAPSATLWSAVSSSTRRRFWSWSGRFLRWSLVNHVKNLEQLLAQLQHLTCGSSLTMWRRLSAIQQSGSSKLNPW